MSNRKDIILNADGSAKVAQGDFVIDYSDGQNGQLLLLIEKGQLRQNPVVGVGLRKLENTKLNPADVLSLKKEIRLQFTNDGYVVNNLTIPNATNVNIDYE